MSWLSGFFATENPRAAASSRTCGLVESPSGKKAAGQLVGVEHPEHVRLVLRGVDGPVQLARPRLRSTTRA